jgi:regulator of sigma E protease
MTIIATLVVLGVLIFVHELGHFWAARSVGIRVDRFSIGLGPRLFGFQRGDTEYVISAIPLGGYVKMAGMEDEVMESIEGGEAGASGETSAQDTTVAATAQADAGHFDAKPVWARAWVISAGVIMNFLFAFLAYTAVAGVWGSPEVDTLRVGDIRTELLPTGTESLQALRPGVEILEVGSRTPAHWGELRDALLELPAGPLTLAFRPSDAGAAGGSDRVEILLPDDRGARIQLIQALDFWVDPLIGEVTPGSPASRAGVRAGDRILAVEGETIERWGPFTLAIQGRPDRITELTVARGDEILTLEVRPEPVEARDPLTDELREIGRVGLGAAPPPTTWAPLALGDALGFGARQTWGVTTFILDFLKQLVTGQASPRNLGSIVTIGAASGQAAAEGLPVFLSFMALLSINLAVLNLLPIPVLDGGHLVFLGLEAVRGRPVSQEQRVRWSQLGFVVLIGIMVLALGNDFLRLFGL